MFRNRKIKPLVGDNVEFDLTDEKDLEGNVTEILPRKNALIRPAAANVDQALVVFAVSHPEPNLNLLDRFLVMMEAQQVPVIICFNKADLQDEGRGEEYRRIYETAGYEVMFTSTYEVGDVANVRVVKLMTFGAFAEIVPGVDGLIHISQIADHRIEKPGDVLAEGDKVDVKITDVDMENQKVSLSIRALLEEAPAEEDEE